MDIGVFPTLTVCDHTIDRKCSLFESAFIRPHRRCMSFSLVSCHTGKESIDCFVVRPVRKGRPSITWVLRYRYPSSCLLFHPHESRPSNAGDLSIVVAAKLTRGSATSNSSRTTWYFIGKLFVTTTSKENAISSFTPQSECPALHVWGMEQDEVGGRRIVRLEASFVVSRLKICRTLDPDVPEPFTETFCDPASLRYYMIGLSIVFISLGSARWPMRIPRS